MSSASGNITYFYNSSQCEEPKHETALFDSFTIQRNQCDQKPASSSYHKTSASNVGNRMADLPDEQSLASALEKLACKDDISDLPPTSSSDEQPSTRCKNAVDKGKSPKVNVNELKKQKPVGLLGDYQEQSQSFPVSYRAMPANSEMYNSFQVLPGVSTRGAEFAASPLQQKSYMNCQPLTYIPYQGIVQSNIRWPGGEENNHSSLQQVYAYQQQIQNQGSQRNQVLNSPIAGTHPQYIEMPNSRQMGEGTQDSSWTHTVVNVGYDRLGTLPMNIHPQRIHCQGLCVKPNYPAIPHSSKQQVGNQTLSELALTHGFNSRRTTKSASVATCQSPCHVEMNRNVSPIDYSDVPYTQNKLYIDRQNSWCSSPYNSEYKQLMGLHQMKFSSEDVVGGKFYFLAKDQKGCCFLQRMLTEGTAEDVEKIFFGVIGHIVDLMTDPIGNYVIQKLIGVCNEDQRSRIVYEITRIPGMLISISCDKHGTRPVQKVIETITRPDQVCMIVSALSLDVHSLMKDANGIHVSLLCLKHLQPEHIEFLLDSATANCFDLAKDRQGCCVLQKCIFYSSEGKRDQLISILTSRALMLSEDKYGNYVIQYILDQKIPWATTKILNQLDGHYGTLSLQKYSSNVVEKCLSLAADARRMRIIQELLHDPSFLDILQDEYGNYVMQLALKVCKGALYDAFIEAIEPHVPALRNTPYGRRVLQSCTRLKNRLS